MRRRVAAGLAVVALAAAAGCGGGGAWEASRPAALRVAVAEPLGNAAIATAFAAADGRVVTVAHVLTPGRGVRVGGARARVVRSAPRLDLALLAVPGVRAAPVRAATAHAGQPVTIAVLRDGRPRELRAMVRRTITARVHTLGRAAPDVRPGLELAARVLPGDSGAPVLDAGGRVVGVVFARADDRANRAYAVDARALPR
jgi:S1-C subfamily serine protease